MSSLTIPADDLQPVDWKVIEDAFYDWITGEIAVGFIWENQNAPQPPYPYVSGLITSIVPEGGVKEQRHQFDAAAAAGEEITIATCGTFTFTLTLQAHVDADSGAYDPRVNAQALATRLQWSLQKGATALIFSTANLAVIAELAQSDLSLVINEEWISRASLDISFRATAVVSETTTFIDKVSGQGDVTLPTRTITFLYDSTI